VRVKGGIAARKRGGKGLQEQVAYLHGGELLKKKNGSIWGEGFFWTALGLEEDAG